MRETGILDSIFGISQKPERIAAEYTGMFKPEEIEGGILRDYSFGGCMTDPTVTVRPGVHVMAAVDDTPAVVVNRYGNGTGIFLNIGMETYEKMRNEGREYQSETYFPGACLTVEWFLPIVRLSIQRDKK